MIEAIFFIWGSIWGSFVNALIYRIPRHLSLVERSKCPRCSSVIPWYLNVPVFAYLFLLGKCAHCSQKISPRYPLIEALCGVMSVALMPQSFSSMTFFYYSLYFFIFCIFVAHFFIDWSFKILPNSLNIALFLLIIPLAYSSHELKTIAYGGAVGFLFPLIVTWVFYLLKGQIGLGGGDIKIFGILGLYLGPIGILQNLFLSCFVGSLVTLSLMILGRMKRTDPIAFGPFIILVASVQIYFPGILKFFPMNLL